MGGDSRPMRVASTWRQLQLPDDLTSLLEERPGSERGKEGRQRSESKRVKGDRGRLRLGHSFVPVPH